MKNFFLLFFGLGCSFAVVSGCNSGSSSSGSFSAPSADYSPPVPPPPTVNHYQDMRSRGHSEEDAIIYSILKQQGYSDYDAVQAMRSSKER